MPLMERQDEARSRRWLAAGTSNTIEFQRHQVLSTVGVRTHASVRHRHLPDGKPSGTFLIGKYCRRGNMNDHVAPEDAARALSEIGRRREQVIRRKSSPAGSGGPTPL
jgi:hypothetical protein